MPAAPSFYAIELDLPSPLLLPSSLPVAILFYHLPCLSIVSMPSLPLPAF